VAAVNSVQQALVASGNWHPNATNAGMPQWTTTGAGGTQTVLAQVMPSATVVGRGGGMNAGPVAAMQPQQLLYQYFGAVEDMNQVR
jgi:hypothetical protein